MLERSRDRILALLPEDAAVLDVGGWARPLPRADHVLDLMPYTPEERVVELWWEGGFPARERIFVGAGELEPWLAAPVRERLAGRPAPRGSLRARLATRGPLARLRR